MCQEFIPSGRQQLLRHPGSIEDPKPHRSEHEHLLSSLERVSLIETKDTERWTIREFAYPYHNKPKKPNSDSSANVNEKTTLSNHSWSWKTAESNKTNRRLSEGNLLKRIHSQRSLAEVELSGSDDSFDAPRSLACKKFGVIEEELYVKDKVVIWSRGLSYVGAGQSSNGRTVCSLTSHNVVSAAIWCTFYCEHPSFDGVTGSVVNKSDEAALGEPLPGLCVVDGHNIRVYSDESEGFVGTLPFQVSLPNFFLTVLGYLCLYVIFVIYGRLE